MKALLLVDLQNDFCHGGRLAVPDGDAVMAVANQLLAKFDLVVATQDWHPKDHASFVTNHPGTQPGDVLMIKNIPQIIWPEHCVQDSPGAEFHPDLDTRNIHKVVFKGVNSEIDSYSAFFDNAHLRHTGLDDYLREHQVTEVYVMGLATDYCVKYSCLDAANLGYQVFVIEDGCRGVELQPGDCAAAFKEMQRAGAQIIKSVDI